MRTILSEDQKALEDSCQKLLQSEWPITEAIKTLGPRGSRHAPGLWKTIAAAGWIGFPFSSEFGGGDADLLDLGVIYRVAGERVLPSSYYSTMFAGLLLDALGTQAQKNELLSPMIAGDLILTAAYAEPHAAESSHLWRVAAEQKKDGWVLNGVKSFVADLGVADVVLVLAHLHSVSKQLGWGVFAVRKGKLGSGVRKMDAFGGTPLWEITFDNLHLPAGALLGGLEAAATTLPAFDSTVEKATALQCMEMAGGIQGVLNFTVDYMKERKQFGKPIGANQAVQHMLANIAIRLDGVRVAAAKALFLVARGRPAQRSLSLAKAALGEAYVDATVQCQQLWGAMGYARETGLFLWTERAKVTDVWHGTRASHLRRLADTMKLAG